jgi:hypothetical protein
VGFYSDAAGKAHGFLLSGDTFTSIDFPGADFIAAVGINPETAIVGRYDTAGTRHGYLLSREGNFTKIDFPGAISSVASGINPAGDITGWYRSADGKFHGFLLAREERNAEH